jgi:hypothetical protein
MRCHSVIDAPEGSAPEHRVPDGIAGYTIVSHSEQYFGYCPICQQAMQAQAASAPNRGALVATERAR